MSTKREFKDAAGRYIPIDETDDFSLTAYRVIGTLLVVALFVAGMYILFLVDAA